MDASYAQRSLLKIKKFIVTFSENKIFTMQRNFNMKNLGKKILGVLGIEAIARLMISDSALNDYGWFLSSKNKKSIDKNGNPIPWLTYPAIDFLKERITKDLLVFEYGSGGSSIWFSKHAKSVDSVEHHPQWHQEILKQTANNHDLTINIKLAELKPEHQALDYHTLAFLRDSDGNNYINQIEKSNKKYHLVIVDGLFRNDCITIATQFLTNDGIIILDNTNYFKELSDGITYMKNQGFKRIDFWGMSPIVGQKSCTTIYYKTDNCFGI